MCVDAFIIHETAPSTVDMGVCILRILVALARADVDSIARLPAMVGVCVSCPLYNASTSYYHDTPSSLGGEEETGGGDTVATNPGQAEQVVDAEPQTDRIHRKQRLGAHTCNMYTAPDTWHLAVFKAFRSELLTSPY